ncbi:hypothetical protein T492DRAFT_870505 [Pavlovales sp. CCMP2436]|nr:hypothetical protein T492DRAFT_870505 [Pavlovales sp. CCMP2436]
MGRFYTNEDAALHIGISRAQLDKLRSTWRVCHRTGFNAFRTADLEPLLEDNKVANALRMAKAAAAAAVEPGGALPASVEPKPKKAKISAQEKTVTPQQEKQDEPSLEDESNFESK